MTNYNTPEPRKRQFLDRGTGLIIVHANSTHDPKHVSQRPIQELIDSEIADYIWEFQAFHHSFVSHDGEVIDCNRDPRNYHIDNLAGDEFILVGGGLGNCHLGVYISLLASRYAHTSTIHLPAPYIYHTARDSFDEEVTDSRIVKLGNPLFNQYEDIAKAIFKEKGCAIYHDNKKTLSQKKPSLTLRIWSEEKLLLKNLPVRREK